MDDKIYDYTGQKLEMRDPSEPAAPGSVDLVVRKSNKYGHAPAGARVRVSALEAKDGSCRSACMTLAEYEELQARLAGQKPKEKKPGALKGVVEEALERAAREATEKHERAKHEAEVAAQMELAESEKRERFQAQTKTAQAEADKLEADRIAAQADLEARERIETEKRQAMKAKKK